ncbi:hypothetical protein OROHE_012271 [Orobanche hederae]
MEPIPVFLYFNGKWFEKDEYKDFEVTGILVPPTITFCAMENLIRQSLKMPSSSNVTMKFQIQNHIPSLDISDATLSTLSFFMEISRKSLDYGKYPIIVEEEEIRQLSICCVEATYLSNAVRSMNKCTAMIPLVAESLDNSQHAERLAEHITAIGNTGQTILEYSAEDDNQVITTTKHVVVKKNQLYANKEILSKILKLHSMQNNREHKVQRSSSRDYVLICMHNKICGWKIRSSRVGRTSLFKIREFNHVHTCSTNILMSSHKQATSEIVSECIKNRFTNLRRIYTPTDIVDDMMEEYNLSISYQKAWRSREKALTKVRGDPHDYTLIPSWLHMTIIANPV